MALVINIDVPYITIKEYVRRTSTEDDYRESIKSIRRQINEGRIPTMPREKEGEKVYINLALLTKQALEAEY